MPTETPWDLYPPPADAEVSHLVDVPWDLAVPEMWEGQSNDEA